MPPYYYHLKLELYATSDPTKTATSTTRAVPASAAKTQPLEEPIWVPGPGANIFDELPSHPRSRLSTPTRWPTTTTNLSYRNGDNNRTGYEAPVLVARSSSKIIDCGAQRGRTHNDSGVGVVNGGVVDDDGRYLVRLSERQYRERVRAEGGEGELSRAPRVEDGIGAEKAVRDWRFGRVRIESLDTGVGDTLKEEDNTSAMMGKEDGGAAAVASATPAASLGPNLGGMGLATKGKYVPLETKNTEAGWGIVHLYREGDETGAWGSAPAAVGEGSGGGNREDGEEGMILCIPAVPSYMGPSDVLGFIGEKWRNDVSHYRMIMTSRMSRYMVLLKFRDAKRGREWRKEFDGKPFDSVEVSFLVPLLTVLKGCTR